MVPETLYNFNLFVVGTNLAGTATEVTPPKLKIKTEDYRGGGMDAAVKLDMGMEAMEASFSLVTLAPAVLKLFGLSDQNAFNGTFRGAFRTTDGKTRRAVLVLRGMLYEIDPGSWKPGEKSESKYSVSVNYYKLEIDGRVWHEIDVLGCKRVIDGVDQLAEVRAAIGM
ncbi:phage major tail tube protein [Ralstonia pickettii]|uniref:phage major tail tube protein n=1 Tax=Ralstonia pickettii TaxID=329 RepID=UPI0004684DA7|nr:phage major tail tube protein [Ralstonia pickettii]